jgi:hypothetical protein
LTPVFAYVQLTNKNFSRSAFIASVGLAQPGAALARAGKIMAAEADAEAMRKSRRFINYACFEVVEGCQISGTLIFANLHQ